MKSLKLSKRQEDKLLKMCKALWSEEDFRIFHYYTTPGKDKGGKTFIQFGAKTKDLYEHMIHWFEFCMTHLVRKIINNQKYPGPNPIYDSTDALCDMVSKQEWFNSESYHPVDYLYEQFKLLNEKTQT